MHLNISRPIAFFDLETTGTDVTSDRIVEIAVLKVFPDGKEEEFTQIINPQIPIPIAASEVHGIYDADVVGKPTFKELASTMHQLFNDADFAGFNSNRFDVPLLIEECLRNDIDINLESKRFIDVQTIFHKMEPRTLSAAYKFYCDKDLIDAHSASADTRATYEVLKSQLTKYSQLENTAEFLGDFSKRETPFLDFAGRIAENEHGEPIFNFGKHKGMRVEDVLRKEPGYFSWMMQADFPLYTKKVLKQIKERLFL
ncbi:MAG: exonuclease domain-containing protein [Luteibaculaceae bacterium]